MLYCYEDELSEKVWASEFAISFLVFWYVKQNWRSKYSNE